METLLYLALWAAGLQVAVLEIPDDGLQSSGFRLSPSVEHADDAPGGNPPP